MWYSLWTLLQAIFAMSMANKDNFYMTPERKISFIQSILKWQNVTYEPCFTLNFGYMKQLPFPAARFSPDSNYNISFNFGNLALTLPNKCSMLTGGHQPCTKFQPAGALWSSL